MRYRWILPLILLIGIAIRLYYLHGTAASPEFRVPLVDNRWYHDRALAWAEGRPGGELDLFRAPLYPFLLGQVYRIFGSGPYAARLFQMVLGIASLVLVFAIGRRLFDAPAGLAAAAIALFYAPFVYFENEILTTALSVFLLLLAFYFLLASEGGGRRAALGAGTSLGLAAATYPTALALVPFVIVWYLRGRRGANGAFLLLALGIAAPPLAAAAWNARAHGAFVLATQGGVNLYIGNNPNADGRTATVPGWRDVAYETKEYEDNVSLAAVRVAEREAGRSLAPAEVDAFWRGRALRWMAGNPAAAARLAAQKVYFLLNAEEVPNNRLLTPYVREYAPFLDRISIGAGILIALGLAGLALRGGGGRGRELLLWFLLAQGAVLVLFFVCSRFRVPMMPFVVLPAAHLVVRLAREGRRFPAGRALLVAMPILFISYTDYYDIKRPGDLPSLLFSRGYAFAEAGDFDRAADLYRESLAEDPSDPRTLINLGTVLARAGRLEEAEETLVQALERDPSYAPFVWNNLAMARLSSGDPDGALVFLERSIAADPNDADVRANAGNVLLSLGRYEEALARLDEALRGAAARELPVRLGRALALSRLGRGEEALAEAERVALAAPAVPEAWAALAEVARAAGDDARAVEARRRFQSLAGRPPGPGDLPIPTASAPPR
ncbi:MAG: tetratricopeptide repeat protein [Candidatus Latescibacterota bacterium]|nr:MAG: tetratricopeptide repeat protein [Candidatus Latescibacterota bacterium]